MSNVMTKDNTKAALELSQRINQVIEESGVDDATALNAILGVTAIRGLFPWLLRMIGIDQGKF